MKNEHLFNSFYDSVVKKSTECGFIKDPINPRKREQPNYSTMDLVDDAASEAQDFHPNTCQDCYRVMYYNVLDTVVTSLKDRFIIRQVLLFTKISNPYYSKQSKGTTLLMSQST